MQGKKGLRYKLSKLLCRPFVCCVQSSMRALGHPSKDVPFQMPTMLISPNKLLICVDLAPRQPGGKGSECRVADIRSFRLRDSCKQQAKQDQLLLSLKYLGWGPT